MGRNSRRAAVIGGMGWLVSFVLAAIALLRLGDVEGMRVPWSDPTAWLATTPPEVAVAALGRVTGLALLGWIALSTVIYSLARLAGVRPTAVGWLSVGPLRRLVDTALAGYLVLGTIAPAGAVVESHHPPPTSQETIDPLYIPTPAGWRAEPTGPVGEQETAEAPDDSPDETDHRARVVVAPGDHLWKLAADRLEEVLGRSPNAAEIAPYWREVVEANRDRIRSGDPDLIFPEERLVLPPVSPES